MIEFKLRFNQEVEHTEMHKICDAMQKLGYRVNHLEAGGVLCQKQEQEQKPQKPTKKKKQQSWSEEKRAAASRRQSLRNQRAQKIREEKGCNWQDAVRQASKELMANNWQKIVIRLGNYHPSVNNGAQYISVQYNGPSYGGCCPCDTEEEMQDYVYRFKQHIKAKGDRPVVVDKRPNRGLLKYIQNVNYS